MDLLLVGRQSFLGFVPRVAVLTVSVTFSFGVLVEGNGLRRPFKVCFSVLRASSRFHSVRNTFITASSKVAVTDRTILSDNDRLKSLRDRLRHRALPFPW